MSSLPAEQADQANRTFEARDMLLSLALAIMAVSSVAVAVGVWLMFAPAS